MFVPAQCQSCLRNIQVPADADVSKCMYCGADVFAANAKTAVRGAGVTNLLGMARTASVAANFGEAESYYNRVLELDPTCSEAWIGKGKSAGWQSTMGNFRTHEMAVSFNHAVGTAVPSDKDTAARSCAHEMNHLVATLYSMANQHMHQFVALEGVWATYLQQVAQLLEGLDAALAWDQNNITTLENIVQLCKDNIEGVSYRDPYDQNLPKAWTLSPEYEHSMRGRLGVASAKLQALNPSYVAPIVEKKKADACFVVTATMGNEDHPIVWQLRNFRSEVLSGTRFGEFLIAWYYNAGPKIARVLDHSALLRRVSLFLVVMPASFLVYVFMPLRNFVRRK